MTCLQMGDLGGRYGQRPVPGEVRAPTECHPVPEQTEFGIEAVELVEDPAPNEQAAGRQPQDLTGTPLVLVDLPGSRPVSRRAELLSDSPKPVISAGRPA